MLREVIKSLQVWDTDAGSAAILNPGAVLMSSRIRRSVGGGPGTDAYIVEFHSSGRRYACPLYLFQPRTQVVETVAEEGIPVRGAVAV